VSRYELQWMVVLNCIVVALFAIVYAIDIDGSVSWGLIVVVAMAGQIYSATRPERPLRAAPKGAEDRSRRNP
jgi:hypothetical protein